MVESLGESLAGFDAALRRLRSALAVDPALCKAVFADSDEWVNLLSYKLVPHLAGEGCLVAAVTGGTNTGKSTVFNLLVGEAVSPVTATAAATRRPVLAAHPSRAAECLEGKLVPEFQALPLTDPESAIARDTPADALYVVESEGLPERLALLDTPDVDSIEREHWTVADNIRAAGDVLVAVLTGEKYKDDRVVAYFRQAAESGRVVVPVMNKANPEDDYAVARRQLEEFRADVGCDGAAFVLPHDFGIAKVPNRPIPSLDGDQQLSDYLLGLDVPAIKERVYRSTVDHFLSRAESFLEHAESMGDVLRSVADEMESRAGSYSQRYDPAPGSEIGGLFHEYVQSHRSAVFRWIGDGSKVVVKGASAMGRGLRNALRRRAILEAPPQRQTDKEVRESHARAIERITRDLASDYIETAQNLREPAGHLVEGPLHDLDLEEAVESVVGQTLHTESISDEFKRHAYKLLDVWWEDNKGKRRILEALDGILAVTPAAIAVPISLHTGGLGVAETVVVAGPIVEQFVARVIEYQFGDALFDFLSPWRAEQQQALQTALLDNVTTPALRSLYDALEPFDGDTMDELRRWLESCRTA
jgi:hypothetical protein